MQLARTDCGGNTQGFLWFGFSAASGRFGLLMDMALNCDEGGGKYSDWRTPEWFGLENLKLISFLGQGHLAEDEAG